MFRNTPFFGATNFNADDVEPPGSEDRELATEALRRVLLWIADAPTLHDRGFRATVALKCLRPDLIKWAPFEKIGSDASKSRQYAHTLSKEFKLLIGRPIKP